MLVGEAFLLAAPENVVQSNQGLQRGHALTPHALHGDFRSVSELLPSDLCIFLMQFHHGLVTDLSLSQEIIGSPRAETINAELDTIMAKCQKLAI